MFEFLSKFEKRMEWVGVANSIINRKGKKTEIENLFNENEMTNIIISILLFIMEKTLEENNECEMYHIENFLADLINKFYNPNLTNEEIKAIANYIVKDILQNNGVKYIYTAKNYDNNTIDNIRIRLITDKIVEDGSSRKIVYMLTNQGYDFLFRTREVDEEIKLTIEQLKLKEYVKRKKFNSAVRQSMELINLVRQKKKDIDNFILLIRQNIHNVDVAEYEELIKSTYSMLNDEYDTMRDIQRLVTQAEDKLREEHEDFKKLDEKVYRAKMDLSDIHHNIGVTLTEQRDLIINRHNLTELFMDTIKKSFEFSYEKRYDFEKIILNSLEEYSFYLDKLYNVIRPLLLPKKNKHLSIFSIYEPQILFKEVETSEPLLIDKNEYDDTSEIERVKDISNRYLEVVKVIFTETVNNCKIELSRILENLKLNNSNLYQEVVKYRCIFRTSLKLYDLEKIKIADFYNGQNRIIMTPTEEFNLEYCLVKLEVMENIKNIIEFQVEKLPAEIEEVLTYEEDGLLIKETIRMSDILFKVVM